MKQLAALCLCAVAVPFAIAQQDSKSPLPSNSNSDSTSNSHSTEFNPFEGSIESLAAEVIVSELAEIEGETPKDDGLSGDPALLTGCTGNIVVRCPATVNSTGNAATLAGTGVPSVSQTGLTLSVSSAPADRPVQFLYSSSPVQLPFGDGWLCVSPYSGVRRLSAVLLTDGSGAVSIAPDFAGSPIAALSTWHFQAWFRDTGAVGGSGINTTNALRITFCP
jgi:hypothetical protein